MSGGMVHDGVYQPVLMQSMQQEMHELRRGIIWTNSEVYEIFETTHSRDIMNLFEICIIYMLP